MSRTRRITGIVALILSLAFLASVPAIRRAELTEVERTNRAISDATRLYWARISAVDDATSRPVAFDLVWDDLLVFPYTKGGGPSVIQSYANGSKSLTIVGRFVEGGLPVSIRAKGYQEASLSIPCERSSSLKVDASSNLYEVRLHR